MSEQLRAAAERLIGKSDPWLGYSETGGVAYDADLLARAYLQANPPSDGEPITAEWCVEIGGYNPGSDVLFRINSAVMVYFDAYDIGIVLRVLNSHCNLPHITTRGQLRRLVAALKGE